jgi:hypothetical protein
VFSHESASLSHNNSLVATNFYSPKSQNKFYTQTLRRERERYERERGVRGVCGEGERS